MSSPDDVKTFSVSIRIRRTTTEYGYVSVEVTPEIIVEDGKLDTEKLFGRAVEYGKEP